MLTITDKISRRFHAACQQYGLLQDDDRILLALSGGKDSLCLARLLAAQQRIYVPHIEVEAAHVVMTNIPYETDRSYLQHFCEEQGLPLHILSSSFDDSESDDARDKHRRKTKCFLCSWQRRKVLFEYAAEHGFNKVCFGHHQDDFIVTYLMNLTLEGRAESIRPIMQMEHYPISIIRPLCLVNEHDIRALADELQFAHLKTPCPYDTVTKRHELADVFARLEQLTPLARHNLWACLSKDF